VMTGITPEEWDAEFGEEGHTPFHGDEE